MKKFNCIFPGLYNYILTKDVGMIPYTLSKKYDTKITTYPNEEFDYMTTLLTSENFSLDYLDNTGNEKRDVKKYLKKHAKNIDILQLYHLRYNLLPHYLFYYKLNNRKGKIFLKLDANNEFIDFLIKRNGLLPSLRRLYVRILFKFIDLISIETKKNYNTLLESNIITEKKLLYLPNGIQANDTKLNDKKHNILYVGYIEKKNKSIDMLLNAVTHIDLKDWKLILVGNVEEDMEEFVKYLFKENPELKDKIIFKGYVSDKERLSEEYANSSIYCCTSKKESFGISTLEAAYHGNYIISTNVGGSPDIIEKTGYGTLIKHDIYELEQKLQYTINNWDNIKENPENIQKKISNEFDWEILCEKIIEKLED
ncbi:glycosyltransferase [Methanosphaera sp.]|uniref:glycosyltransferase family 4 protein n=1 Tax=Methanosphaera sp. TaxID=2666342 RepID=UPI0025D1B476|nr:glycosyltransferase [Methanosphaera sp.]